MHVAPDVVAVVGLLDAVRPSSFCCCSYSDIGVIVVIVVIVAIVVVVLNAI